MPSISQWKIDFNQTCCLQHRGPRTPISGSIWRRPLFRAVPGTRLSSAHNGRCSLPLTSIAICVRTGWFWLSTCWCLLCLMYTIRYVYINTYKYTVDYIIFIYMHTYHDDCWCYEIMWLHDTTCRIILYGFYSLFNKFWECVCVCVFNCTHSPIGIHREFTGVLHVKTKV